MASVITTSSGVDLMFVNPKVAVISTGAFDGVEISNACMRLARVKCSI